MEREEHARERKSFFLFGRIYFFCWEHQFSFRWCAALSVRKAHFTHFFDSTSGVRKKSIAGIDCKKRAHTRRARRRKQNVGYSFLSCYSSHKDRISCLKEERKKKCVGIGKKRKKSKDIVKHQRKESQSVSREFTCFQDKHLSIIAVFVRLQFDPQKENEDSLRWRSSRENKKSLMKNKEQQETLMKSLQQ